MATWHKGADPLLNMDIAALAGTVSKTVHTCAQGESLGGGMAAAVAATQHAEAAGGSRIATLIVAHDLSWERSSAAVGAGAAGGPAAAQQTTLGGSINGSNGGLAMGPGSAAGRFIADCAAALRRCPRGRAALLVGGAATLADGATPDISGGAVGTAPAWRAGLG